MIAFTVKKIYFLYKNMFSFLNIYSTIQLLGNFFCLCHSFFFTVQNQLKLNFLVLTHGLYTNIFYRFVNRRELVYFFNLEVFGDIK